jgi:hypothetical protein
MFAKTLVFSPIAERTIRRCRNYGSVYGLRSSSKARIAILRRDSARRSYRSSAYRLPRPRLRGSVLASATERAWIDVPITVQVWPGQMMVDDLVTLARELSHHPESDNCEVMIKRVGEPYSRTLHDDEASCVDSGQFVQVRAPEIFPRPLQIA